MKRTISFLCLLAVVAAVSAQQYVVVAVTGDVQVVSGKDSRPLQLREKLSPSAVLTIAYKGQADLLDEQGRRKVTLKSPGRAALSQLLQDKNTTVLRLTEQYLSYLRSRVQGSGELTSRRRSDPATVTREVAFERDPFQEEYDAFKKKAWQEYEEFRNKAISEYAAFVRQAWKEFGAQPARQQPLDDMLPPQVAPLNLGAPIGSAPIRIEGKPLALPQPKPQPKPAVPIMEIADEEVEYADFSFYGTPLCVRFSGKELFNIASLTPDGVADVIERLATSDFNNTIRDCLELRIRYQLDDWAYLQMLKSLSKACFATADEATLLMAFLYQQSGYKMRLGISGGHLVMLYATDHYVYSRPYFSVDGEDYYVFEGDAERMKVCQAAFPNEQSLSLYMTHQPMLAEQPVAERRLKSERYGEMDFNVAVNSNLIDFYNDYPTSMVGGNFMTRWAMYANTPLDETLGATLVPAMKKLLAEKSQLEAVERLLNWVQTALAYEYDDKVWGHDRAFFAEESLHYPYCDCEDRSILLSRLVRDVLGLKTVLVYYPGHLAMAVGFTEQVNGDYIELDGRRYTVCDPTFIGARVGRTMPQMDNQTARVILLE